MPPAIAIARTSCYLSFGQQQGSNVGKPAITVIGAGIIGLWQARELARRGFRVTLYEAAPQGHVGASSRYAGAMLAPFCEAEAAEPIVESLGRLGIERWREAYPGTVARGTLVVAAPRDLGELKRFAGMTRGHEAVDVAALASLEPELAGRFTRGLLFAAEAHLAPRPAMDFLLAELQRQGVELVLGRAVPEPVHLAAAAGEAVVDCRGMAARGALADLRGVRGEMAVVHAPDVALSRPVRLLHPRFPLYVVPWGEGHYMLGATVIESEDTGPVSVRSALELLGNAFALHPGFAEAVIVELGAGVRPAFANNVPAIVRRGRHILVNGAYRHGFLLAPALAEGVANYLEHDRADHPLLRAG